MTRELLACNTTPMRPRTLRRRRSKHPCLSRRGLGEGRRSKHGRTRSHTPVVWRWPWGPKLYDRRGPNLLTTASRPTHSHSATRPPHRSPTTRRGNPAAKCDVSLTLNPKSLRRQNGRIYDAKDIGNI